MTRLIRRFRDKQEQEELLFIIDPALGHSPLLIDVCYYYNAINTINASIKSY